MGDLRKGGCSGASIVTCGRLAGAEGHDVANCSVEDALSGAEAERGNGDVSEASEEYIKGGGEVRRSVPTLTFGSECEWDVPGP